MAASAAAEGADVIVFPEMFRTVTAASMGGPQPDLVITDFDLDRIRALQKEDWFRRVR